jgi:hypothetical protein
MHEKSGWIVWNFEDKPLNFLNEDITLSSRFPQFANVYHVSSTKKGNQNFLKCDCLLYERCGIPCCHILKITDVVESTMIKIQHWKVFHVHFGVVESEISSQLMKGLSIQLIDEGMGVPISKEVLMNANFPNTSRYVNSYISNILCEFPSTVSSYRHPINHTCQLYCFTQLILYIM